MLKSKDNSYLLINRWSIFNNPMPRRQECTGLWVWNTANDTPGYSSLIGKYSIFFNHTSLTRNFQTNSLSQLSQSSRIDRTFRQSSMVGNNSFLSNYECSIPFRHTRALITILRLRLPFVIKIKRHSTSRGGARCMELHCSDRDWDGKSIGFFSFCCRFFCCRCSFKANWSRQLCDVCFPFFLLSIMKLYLHILRSCLNIIVLLMSNETASHCIWRSFPIYCRASYLFFYLPPF